MATATDIRGLCERIDAGEDDLLPMLADALEEMGDARAAGLRLVMERGYRSGHDTPFGWPTDGVFRHPAYPDWPAVPHDVPHSLLVCLRYHPDALPMHSHWQVEFGRHSVAYLALAAALSGGDDGR